MREGPYTVANYSSLLLLIPHICWEEKVRCVCNKTSSKYVCFKKECAESNSMVKGPENAQRKDTIKRSVFDQHEKTLLELKTIGFAGINLLDN